MMPPGAEPIPAGSPFTFDPPLPDVPFRPGERTQGALLGCFGRAGKGSVWPTHAIVVNLDYVAERDITLRGPGQLEVFDADTRKWSPVHSASVTLHLPPGGGKLVRVRRR